MPRGPELRHGVKTAKIHRSTSPSKSRPEKQPIADACVDTSDTAAASKLAPGLYIVSTPIGNMGDITLRALEVLKNVELIACEDTRRTGKLLSRHGIKARRTAYHEHNAQRVRPKLLRQLQGGAAIALGSDAGTPLVSDPGYRLVRETIAALVPVCPVPGPSSPLAALVASGLPSDRFLFGGFLPPASGPRRRAIRELADVNVTLLFLESPRRLAMTLDDMAKELGDREVVIARELTKIHEEVTRGQLTELSSHYRKEAKTGNVARGEIVIVIGPDAKNRRKVLGDEMTDESDTLLTVALQNMGTKEAAETVGRITGHSRRELYARALKLTKSRE